MNLDNISYKKGKLIIDAFFVLLTMLLMGWMFIFVKCASSSQKTVTYESEKLYYKQFKGKVIKGIIEDSNGRILNVYFTDGTALALECCKCPIKVKYEK